MNIQTQIMEDQQARLTVEVEASQLEEMKRRAAARMARKIKIPGFRPGKAPYAVILRTVGEAGVTEEAMELLVDDIYPQVIKESGLNPYGPGRLDNVVSIDPPKFEFVVPLAPDVTLGDYHSIRSPYELPQVTDEDVTAVLQDFRERQAIVEPVERPIQTGDQVVVNFSAVRADAEIGPESSDQAAQEDEEQTIAAEEEQDPDVEEQEAEEQALDDVEEQDAQADEQDSLLIPQRTRTVVVKGDSAVEEWPYAGFSQELVGMSAGEEKHVEYTYPDDSHQEVYRGVSALFDIKVESVKSHTLPELNDEFARGVGDFDTLEALNVRILTGLKEQKLEEYNEAYDEEILKQCLEQTSFKYPPQMLENEIDQVLHDLTHRLERQNLDINLYMKARNLDQDGLRAELKPVAEQRLQRSLFLFHLAQAENIQIQQEEVEREAVQYINYLYSQMPEKEARKLMQKDVRDNLISNVLSDLISRRSMERLRDITSGRRDIAEAEALAAAQVEAEVSETDEAVEAVANQAPEVEAEAQTSDPELSVSDQQPELQPDPVAEEAAPEADPAPTTE